MPQYPSSDQFSPSHFAEWDDVDPSATPVGDDEPDGDPDDDSPDMPHAVALGYDDDYGPGDDDEPDDDWEPGDDELDEYDPEDDCVDCLTAGMDCPYGPGSEYR